MRISLNITDDPLEVTVDIEHPVAELAIGRAVELMELLAGNITMHASYVPPPPKKNARGFATPEMESKP